MDLKVIAVGMATKIPPHNLSEVIDGTVALIDNPEISVKQLMKYIKGLTFQLVPQLWELTEFIRPIQQEEDLLR
jgi:DNA gyrase/topoisomerase IV subunit A